MKYNHLFDSRFSGCLHLASYHDPHRNRNVKIFMIPGDHEVVGVSDGVDAWIAPANIMVPGHSGGPGKIDLVAILHSVRAGTFKGPAAAKIPRRMIRLESAAQPGQQETKAPAEVRTTRRKFINV